MSSIFDSELSEIYRKKLRFEVLVRNEINEALVYFVNKTGVNPKDVTFRQDGFLVENNELTSRKGIVTFDWGLVVHHAAQELHASCQISVEKNASNEIVFNLGVYEPNDNKLNKSEFMANLIDSLMGQLVEKVS